MSEFMFETVRSIVQMRSHELVHIIVPACTPCGHDLKVSLLAFIFPTTKENMYKKANNASISFITNSILFSGLVTVTVIELVKTHAGF